MLGQPGASVGSVLHQRRVSGRNVSSRHDRHAAASQSSARRADRAPTTAQLYSSVPVRATMGDIRCVVCITLFICIDAYYTHIQKCTWHSDGVHHPIIPTPPLWRPVSIFAGHHPNPSDQIPPSMSQGPGCHEEPHRTPAPRGHTVNTRAIAHRQCVRPSPPRAR